MLDTLNQILDKISSYNIFNNLYPGVIFCYVLKAFYNINIFTDNWIENIMVCYFFGMIFSRIGSLVISPIFNKLKKFNGEPLLNRVKHEDYERASNDKSLITVLSETNNTYRTILAMLLSLLFFTICIKINEFIVYLGCTFFQENIFVIVLIFLIILFSLAYVKQTDYVSKNVNDVLNRTKND